MSVFVAGQPAPWWMPDWAQDLPSLTPLVYPQPAPDPALLSDGQLQARLLDLTRASRRLRGAA